MSRLYDELRVIIDALDREKIDYALCGGIAMAIHGRLRATIDIDMLILSDSLPRVLEIAEQHGHTIRGLDMNFGAIQSRRVSKQSEPGCDVLTRDFIVVTDAIRGVWDSRVKASWRVANFP